MLAAPRGGRPLTVCQVITGLGTGGAERQLLRVSERLVACGMRVMVVSLGGRGTTGAALERAGVELHTLEGGPDLRAAMLPVRLARLIRRAEPDVVHGWMWHANLVATAAHALARRRGALAWNVRASIDDFATVGTATGLTVRVGARLSRRPAVVVYNSRASADQHEALGYDAARTLVIPNGFDCNEYAPDPQAGARLRAELGLPAETRLVGHFARLHPMKDHPALLRAFALAAGAAPDAHLVACGRGVTRETPLFAEFLRQSALADRVHLLGERRDMPALMAGVDLAVSSSACLEGFPNVVGEAMACGTPCVVTDVGDAAWVVGGTGRVVPPRAPEQLAEALVATLRETPAERADRGRLARQRIVAEFSIDRVLARYAELYERLAATAAA